MIAAALSDLTTQAPAVVNQVVGAVLFGYPHNRQDGGRVPHYPTEKTEVFCAPGDVLCDGLLLVLPPHYTYGSDAGSAAEFLAQRVAIA